MGFVTWGVIPATWGVIFVTWGVTENTEKCVTFYKAGSATAEAVTGGALVGNIGADNMTVNSGDNADKYILQNGKWRKTPTSGTACYIAQYRAYLDMSKVSVLSTEQAAKFVSFNMTEGNETTGIDGVDKQTVTDGACYTLGGVRMNDTTKGLYIKSGKKVIIK